MAWRRQYAYLLSVAQRIGGDLKYCDCSIQHYTVDFFCGLEILESLQQVFEFTTLSILATYVLVSCAIMVALLLNI